MSTISLMMWRGVRNWPLTPAVAILDSRYSYRSPLVSRSAMGMSSSMSTTRDSNCGVGMVDRASFHGLFVCTATALMPFIVEVSMNATLNIRTSADR